MPPVPSLRWWTRRTQARLRLLRRSALAACGESGQERCGTGIQAPAETQAGSLCHNFCHGLLGLVAVLSPLLSCSPSARPPASTGKGFIAIVGAGQDDPLWPVLRGSALRQQGFVGEVPLRAVAPPTVSTLAQTQLIDQLYREGMRGLCVQVIDPQAIGPYLKGLAQHGVPVVTMVHSVEGQQGLMHCGVDQRLVGEALADSIAGALQDKGTIAVVHANSSVPYARERYEAFSARLKRYPRIMVLREFDCGGNPQRAREMMRGCMRRFPRLNAWVAIDNWPLRGLDLQERLFPTSCRLVTTDPQPQVWDHLSTGTCLAMIGAEYFQVAEQAVIKCAAALERNLDRWPTFLAPPRPVRASDLHLYKTDWMAWCSRGAPSVP
ncbi:MAG: substrate-binding domain-containing protein [Planctomycetota bacterium]